MVEPAHPVIVFDGLCNLCGGWARFVLARDRAGRFRFASLQSEAGRRLAASHGLDPDDPVSLLLIEGGVAHTDSAAILRVLAAFGGAWRLAGLARLVPAFVRDRLYRLIAQNRYRWFGRRESCLVPPADAAERFLGGD